MACPISVQGDFPWLISPRTIFWGIKHPYSSSMGVHHLILPPYWVIKTPHQIFQFWFRGHKARQSFLVVSVPAVKRIPVINPEFHGFWTLLQYIWIHLKLEPTMATPMDDPNAPPTQIIILAPDTKIAPENLLSQK